MIQLLGNGRGQYGSTRNVGLWLLAGKAKISVASAAIKNVHRSFSMMSSLVVRPAVDRTRRGRGGTVALHTFARRLADKPLYAVCGAAHNDHAPARSGAVVLTSDALSSYSCARCLCLQDAEALATVRQIASRSIANLAHLRTRFDSSLCFKPN